MQLSSRRAEVGPLSDRRSGRCRTGSSSRRSSDALAREARRLGFIRPGEHLFIVKGIQAWKKPHTTTIDGDGK